MEENYLENPGINRRNLQRKNCSAIISKKDNMIEIKELNNTWAIITKNRACKTDAQVINFFRAVQHGKNLVKDVTPEMISSLDTETADKVKRINLLFDMMKDAQEKAFGGIIDKNY